MHIRQLDVTVREIAKNYINNNDENGVIGYDGNLNIRPAYQREFVYKDKQRDAVISTIRKGYPLNVIYWAKNADGTYEVLDGQQRTISFCDFVAGKYSINGEYFHTLSDAEQDEILNYHLIVFVCEGTDKDRLDWFRTINIAGEKLTDQELLNINYTGKWLSDAKRRFSKTGCVAYKIANNLVSGSPIRQEFLETALDWISNGKIAEYMAAHYRDENSDELWQYFQNVIDWVNSVFPNYRKEMKGLDWGKFYRDYKDNAYNAEELETEISNLMADDEVTNKKGIYEYVFDCDEKHLNLRSFTDKEKRTMYEKQGGICPIDGQHYAIDEMDAHHIDPWDLGGKTVLSNCVMLNKRNHHKYIHTSAMINPQALREKRDELLDNRENFTPIIPQ